MDFSPLLITGDEDETCVLSHNTSSRGAFLARFLRDAQCPDSISSRIVACFHGIKVDDPSTQSFPDDRVAMREAIRQEIQRALPTFMNNPQIYEQGVTLDLGAEGQTGWTVCLNDVTYNEFTSHLQPYSNIHEQLTHNDISTQFVYYDKLVPTEHAGGRGHAKTVRFATREDNLSSEDSQEYFLKGLDFVQFLDGEQFSYNRDAFYHELELVCRMPRHPYIMSPPLALVLFKSGVQRNSSEHRHPNLDHSLVGGVLYPFSAHGSLESVIRDAVKKNKRLRLSEKSKWCYNLSAGLLHLHRVARTYHMDIKTANVLISDDTDNGGRKAVFIDFEQSGAAPWYIAPEVDGSYDVTEIVIGTASRLVYTKYEGPPRSNNWCDPTWNVFPAWSQRCPKALEAAEVYSLGKTMWCLLQQVSGDDMADSARDLKPGEQIKEIWWDDSAKDIPTAWKEIIDQCPKTDPNERISLDDLVTFWAGAESEYR